MNGAFGKKSYGRLDAGGMTICKIYKKDLIMRLWHQKLIPYLDNKRLLSQHRECCALRGKGWGKKHSVVDYVFKYDLAHLYEYHKLVMHEMAKRNYVVDVNWYGRTYRGKHLPKATLCEIGTFVSLVDAKSFWSMKFMIYPEHNAKYLRECLLNLRAKGAKLVNGKTIEDFLINLDLKGV